ncbi:MAG: alpha/beta hydrolase [Gaiellaceae bacterium]
MGLKVSAPALLVAAALAFGAPGTARAAACGTGRTTVVCTSVVVPLDRTGAVPGTVSLRVDEVPPPAGTPRGAVFLIAGGPGQGSASTFDLSSTNTILLFQALFPGYTLVAYDDRGTGDSGLLNCPALQTATTPDGEDLLASACASSIGAGAAFYGTADHVEDLDAVRNALGLDKIVLYGVSYGTKLALAYASAHPTHVDRMVLDSVLPPGLPDPYSANVARAMPATLSAFCANACSAATHDFAGDVVAVANRLGAKPARANVLQPSGKTKPDMLTGAGLLSLVVDADLDQGLAAELPAAVHAARLGNMAPLFRLHAVDNAINVIPSVDLSFGLFAATVCRDGPFPWPADSAPATRAALLKAAIAALPAGTFGPFGSYAANVGNAVLCDAWPAPSGGAVLTPGPFPNVPMLALSGGFDMRTPTASAQAVVSQFPQGQLVVVPGVGHSVVTGDVSFCALLAVRDFMQGAAPNTNCQRAPFVIAPLAAFPKLASTTKRASPSATYAVATRTMKEAEAMWWIARQAPTPRPVAGLTSGTLTPAGDQLRLKSYGLVAGLTITGTLTRDANSSGFPYVFQGSVTVGGRLASPGKLEQLSSGIGGTLGGRSVP